jgi:hypothetical protein
MLAWVTHASTSRARDATMSGEMKLTLAGAHALPRPTLRARIDERVAFYDRAHPALGIRGYYAWDADDRATARYRGGVAHVSLEENRIVVEIELPFIARLYRARIEDFIRREIDAVTGASDAAPPTPPSG